METGIAQLEYQNLLGLGLPEVPRQLAGNGVVEGAATDDVAMSLRRKPRSGVMWPTIFLFGGGIPSPPLGGWQLYLRFSNGRVGFHEALMYWIIIVNCY